MYSIENYELLLPNNSTKEINMTKDNNTNKIFKNLITCINMNFYNEEKIIDTDTLDLDKIYNILIDLQEKIQYNISYNVSEFALDLDYTEAVNPSMFKKNKYGLYNNSLENIIYSEINYFNDRLRFFHNEIDIIISMIRREGLHNNLLPQL